MEKHKKLSNKKFEMYIDLISDRLKNFLLQTDIKIDYICPILRSGGVPAVYIANKLNIVKFAPIQVKHIEYEDGTSGYTNLFIPFDLLNINKEQPVFLLIDATCSSGKSTQICINEIKNKYKNAKILYICIAKQYGGKDFDKDVIYEDCGFYYNGNNEFTKEKCQRLKINYYLPLYPWEILDQERSHPDDLEKNIYF